VRGAIEVALAQGAPGAKRPYLLNIGVDKEGIHRPVGKKIKRGFEEAKMIYKNAKKGELANYIPES